MQDCSAFVGDGYDVDRYIKSVPGLYPEVRMTIRQMTVAETDKWSHRRDHAAPSDRRAATNQVMAEHIVSWSLPEKPDAETCGKLVPALYDRVFGLIWGMKGDDSDELGNSPAG